MRIGIDVISLQNNSQNRGIGTFTRCLIKNILTIDRENEYVFFVFGNRPLPSLLREEIFKDIKIRKVTSITKRFSWLSGQFFFPPAIKEERLDIFHSPEYILPALSKSKKIITVHDFINSDYKIYRKRSSFIRRIYFYLKNETLKRADKIIAASEYTKSKIMELVGIDEGRIKVIYYGVDEIFIPLNDNTLFSKLRNKYGIKGDFLFFAGVIDHHKNIHGLIKAFSRVRFKDIGLVLVGAKSYDVKYVRSIKALIERLGIKDRVYILGYIPPGEDLVGLYNMAKMVISVSFYEGFGLPILEAMSCGTPVIAAKNTSMREIVDSSGILIDPYNIEEITHAIDNLLSDEELRNTLSKKGRGRAKEFSWKKTAIETTSLYKDLLR